MKKRVLVIEDTPEIARLLEAILTQAGMETTVAPSGKAGMQAFREGQHDLVLLDLMLPDMDGGDICRQIRAISHVPLIMVTARTDDMDKVIGLEIGADDYVTKPFNKHELLARVRALLRRSEAWTRPPEGSRERISAHGITLGPLERRTWVADAEVALTHTEFDLLLLMMQNPGLVVTREQLLERIWGIRSLELDTRTVDNHIARLRKKLAAAAPPGVEASIETVPGVGYRFKADD